MRPYISPHFYCSFAPDRDPNIDHATRHFKKTWEGASPEKFHWDFRETNVVLLMNAGVIHVEYPECGLEIFISGDLYVPSPHQAIAESIKNRGLDGLTDLPGSYVMVVADTRAGVIRFITDDNNSRKLFSHYAGPILMFHTDLLASGVPHTLDLNAMAIFLSAASTINNRTLLREITIEKPGMVITVTDATIERKSHSDFSYQPIRSKPSDLIARIDDALRHSVSDRLYGLEQFFVSLTGGYDSTSILGTLHRLQVPNVTCVTFAHGHQSSNRSDEYVAHAMADRCGYPFELIEICPSYDDFPAIIELNALRSQCLSFNDDALVYGYLMDKYKTGEKSGMFVGDTFFDMDNCRLWSDSDFIEASIYTKPLSRNSLLASLLGPSLFSLLCGKQQEEFRQFLDDFNAIRDRHERRDQMYIHGRQIPLLFTWREKTVGHHLHPLNPLTDRRLKTIALSLPHDLLLDKKLFKQAVQSLYPDLATIPRASHASFLGYIHKAIHHCQPRLHELLDAPSVLDDLFPPATIHRIIDVCVQEQPIKAAESLKSKAIKAVRKEVEQHPALSRAIRGMKSINGEILTPDRFVKRYFTLRFFLKQFSITIPDS